jgi:hypothetical protein
VESPYNNPSGVKKFCPVPPLDTSIIWTELGTPKESNHTIWFAVELNTFNALDPFPYNNPLEDTDANPVPPRETFTGELKENVFPTRESPVPAR